MPIKRVTTPLLLVMNAFVREPTQSHRGYRLAKNTGLPAGTIQPILTRMEDEGWLDVEWEDIDARAEGRRPRRLYTLTANGYEEIRSLLYEHRARVEPLLGGIPRGAES